MRYLKHFPYCDFMCFRGRCRMCCRAESIVDDDYSWWKNSSQQMSDIFRNYVNIKLSTSINQLKGVKTLRENLSTLKQKVIFFTNSIWSESHSLTISLRTASHWSDGKNEKLKPKDGKWKEKKSWDEVKINWILVEGKVLKHWRNLKQLWCIIFK